MARCRVSLHEAEKFRLPRRPRLRRTGTQFTGRPREVRNRSEQLAFFGQRHPTSGHNHEPEVHGFISASQERASILF